MQLFLFFSLIDDLKHHPTYTFHHSHYYLLNGLSTLSMKPLPFDGKEEEMR